MSNYLQINLTDKEYQTIKSIWEEIILKSLSKNALEMLEWEIIENFVSDVFRRGMETTSEDPMSFINNKILQKFPVLKEEFNEEGVKEDFDKRKKIGF